MLAFTDMELTAVYKKVPEGYIAWVEDLPGANTQGVTLDEARENLREAIRMVLDANRELAESELEGEEIIKEPVSLSGL
ncbi:MAG TPA: type II toxin-antitoxin system HicB family antitoxin [Terriglobia bacterium]|nr:type II toxin-antitoxin system HicB family antitoxin [Terriglobia bacterium]